MRILRTRHGETVENAAGIVQGHIGGELSALGWEQVRGLGGRLRDRRIDFIFSSDLNRAVQSAEEIRKRHENPNVPLILTTALRERDFGDYDGKSKHSIPDFRKWHDDDLMNPDYGNLRNEEPLRNVLVRVRTFLSQVAEYRDANILLVSSGQTGIIIEAAINGVSMYDLRSIQHMENAGLREYTFKELRRAR